MTDQILTDMAQDIGETKGMVIGLTKQISDLNKAMTRQDTRIRRIENFFLPAVAVVGLLSQKILKVFGF